jgi:hypothetical protein
LERSGGSRRGRVDDLDEVIFKLAAVPERTADKVCVRRSGASVKSGTGEVEDGGDSVGLDRVTAEVLGTFEVCKRFDVESRVGIGDNPWY